MNKLLRFCCVLALSLAPAFAVDWKALKPQGYVSDFGSVIDAESKAELENYCGRVEQQTGAQMALVTIQSLSGEPIDDVANTIYRAWGVGKKGKDEGILLLLSISEFIGFGLAYLIAAVASTLLITWYCRFFLGGGARTLMIGSGLAGVYTFLYITLRQQDYALLMGATALFIVLAIVMYVTRKVDWYARDAG